MTTFLIAKGWRVACQPTELGQQIERVVTRAASRESAIDAFAPWLEERLESC